MRSKEIFRKLGDYGVAGERIRKDRRRIFGTTRLEKPVASRHKLFTLDTAVVRPETVDLDHQVVLVGVGRSTPTCRK